jgi:hypothetical protein
VRDHVVALGGGGLLSALIQHVTGDATLATASGAAGAFVVLSLRVLRLAARTLRQYRQHVERQERVLDGMAQTLDAIRQALKVPPVSGTSSAPPAVAPVPTPAPASAPATAES